jgi:hypothetical protein
MAFAAAAQRDFPAREPFKRAIGTPFFPPPARMPEACP